MIHFGNLCSSWGCIGHVWQTPWVSSPVSHPFLRHKLNLFCPLRNVTKSQKCQNISRAVQLSLLLAVSVPDVHTMVTAAREPRSYKELSGLKRDVPGKAPPHRRHGRRGGKCSSYDTRIVPPIMSVPCSKQLRTSLLTQGIKGQVRAGEKSANRKYSGRKRDCCLKGLSSCLYY